MADCRGPFPNCFSLQLLLWNCILWFPCDGTEADFSFNFLQAFPFFSPSLSPFCAFFSKRAKLTTCCDVSFFSVVVHCLLFCPPPPTFCAYSHVFLRFGHWNKTENLFFPSLSVALLNPYLLLSFSLFQLFFFDLSPISPALFYCLISWQLQQYSSERARWNPESTVTFVSHWGHYQWQAISCNAF